MASMMSLKRELLRISEQLSETEVSNLRFLCRDELHAWASMSTVELLMALFIMGGNAQLIAKLTALGRLDLLRRLGLHSVQVERGACGKNGMAPSSGSNVSRYREILVELSESISNQELSSITYCLKDDLPPNKLNKVNSLLELCQLLEEQDQLSSDNLSMLEQCFDIVERKDLIKKLDHFKLELSKGRPADNATFVRIQNQVYVNAHPAAVSREVMHMRVHSGETSRGGRVQMVENRYSTGHPSASGIAGSLSQFPNAYSHTPMLYQQIPVGLSATRPSRVGPNSASSLKLESDGYPMIAPLGLCLLVLNIQGLKNQDVLIADAGKIQKTFSHLGFEVKTVHNLSSTHMLHLNRDPAIANLYSCFVCVVLGKGTDSEVIGTDGKPVPMEMLLMGFNGLYCQALVGKPKLFFIQTVMVDENVNSQSLQVDSSWTFDDHYLETDAPGIPIDADVLECKHSVEDTLTEDEAKNIGTPFIKHLTDCLNELWPMGHDVLAVLTEVNRRVTTEVSHGLQQRPPKLSNTLRKRLIFPQT